MSHRFKRAKIIACRPETNYCVWIRFDDRLEGVVDLSYLVGKGVFVAWKSEAFFNQVKIDSISDTLCWGNEIDLDAYVLREKIMQNKKL